MLSAFLAQLPKVGRGVLAKGDRHCPICFEHYNTSASGTAEHAVRLPCNHVVGFHCISAWLTPAEGQRGNKTCPLCRHVFLEIELSAVPESLRLSIAKMGYYLSLSTEAINMTLCIAKRFHSWVSILDYPLTAIVVASLHMASHAMNESRSLDDISSCIDVTDLEGVRYGIIQGTYHTIYRFRRELIHEPLLERVTGRTLNTIDDVLPKPSISFVAAVCQESLRRATEP